MSDLPITPEQALQLVELIEDTARELEKAGRKEEAAMFFCKAKNLRQYVEVSRHLYDAQKNPPREKS
jgi:hypothetical protein